MSALRSVFALSLCGAISAAAACSSKSEEPAASSGGSGGSGGSAGTAGSHAGSSGTAGTGIISLDSGKDAAGDAGCGFATVQSDLLPANVLFIVDRSGSMNCNLPPDQTSEECEASPVAKDPSQPTKWSVITAVLKDTFGSMPPTSRVGITYFSNDNSCGVQSTPNVPLAALDPSQLAALDSSLTNVTPKGGTPMVGATILAYKYIHEVAKPKGNRFVVVITDGADTCSPDAIQTLVDVEVAKAIEVNIKTFAIGAPGSEPARAVLSQMAFAGGSARSADCDHSGSAIDAGDCHFDMTVSTDLAGDLADALAAISGQALSCEITVPDGVDGQPVDYSKVNVTYTPGDGSAPQDILQDPSAGCDSGAQGWQYTKDKKKILLCGSICDTVQSDTGARVDILFGCETQQVR